MKRGADQTSISSFFGTPSKRQAIETSDGKPANNSPKSTKHRDAFYKPWLQKYTWIVHEDDEGMFCALCTKHKQLPRNGSTSWIKTPCQSYREDAIRRHQDSTCHIVEIMLCI
ncbi:uncharacterized protein LOC117335432 [Pecten maximus]|uniref:uncharacterized protein LOC117335432 n=1 Tax=Pecten maximus TaxID=6579 RepID=UPI0014584BC2|nr:uncharacterized protein LOC117335432 [Pecten maximus]